MSSVKMANVEGGEEFVTENVQLVAAINIYIPLCHLFFINLKVGRYLKYIGMIK